MKVIWTDEALERMSEIDEFISRDSPLKAEEFIDFLISQEEIISQNPEIGRVVPELSNSGIRELIIKGYRLVYRIMSHRIEILTVFEGHKLLRIDGINK
ncbi:MAG: type II toxin-antitoxin system RelE/ParE family toxin [Spirochaetales bacterium]|jgi:addiction module RelE/StbE family toxin|nr:type II toxin-antitoxin system RelE/ParE family toxin [Spirochaetales bacterium]